MSPIERDSFNLLYYLRIFNRWKRWIFLPALCVSFVVLVIGLRSPRPYVAEATILTGGESLTINSIAGLGIPGLSMGNPNVAILSQLIRSRRMAEDIVDHFKLMEKGYGTNRHLLVSKVRRMIAIQEQKNGLLIQVTTTDPTLSSDIANFCISNLNAMNEQFEITTQKPIAKVLDSAIPPLFPSSRKIIPRVLLSFLAWMTGSTVFFFLREYLKGLRQREAEEQMFSGEASEKDKERVFS